MGKTYNNTESQYSKEDADISYLTFLLTVDAKAM